MSFLVLCIDPAPRHGSGLVIPKCELIIWYALSRRYPASISNHASQTKQRPPPARSSKKAYHAWWLYSTHTASHCKDIQLGYISAEIYVPYFDHLLLLGYVHEQPITNGHYNVLLDLWFRESLLHCNLVILLVVAINYEGAAQLKRKHPTLCLHATPVDPIE